MNNDLAVKVRDDILISSLDEQEGIVLDIEYKSRRNRKLAIVG